MLAMQDARVLFVSAAQAWACRQICSSLRLRSHTPSPTCQNRDWPAHKQTCRASKPSVVLLQLASESWYAEMYQDFLRLLRAKANVIVAETAQQARDALAAQPAPRAVILADGGIMDDEHVAFRPRLAAYVRAGGRAVVAGQFGNMDSTLRAACPRTRH
jgi:hypothetical protein